LIETTVIPPHLRWRCRRGMRELDVLLSRWLESSYLTASEQSQRDFEALLGREDDEVWDWMMGRAQPPQELTAIVAAVCSQHESDQSHS